MRGGELSMRRERVRAAGGGCGAGHVGGEGVGG